MTPGKPSVPPRTPAAVLRDLRQRLPLLGRGLGLAWRAAPGWTSAWSGLLLIQGLLPIAQISLLRLTVDRLAALMAAPTPPSSLTGLWPLLLLIALLWLLGQALTSLIRWTRAAQTERVQDHLHALIHDQATRLDLTYYEQPEYYDLLHQARVDAINQPLALLEHLGGLLQNGLTLLALAVLLAVHYAGWLPLLLLGSALPGLWVVGRHTWREYQWRLNHTVHERWARYYDWMLTQREAAAELRLFDLAAHYRRQFQDGRARLRRGRQALDSQELRAELAAGGLAWLGGVGGMAWMIGQVVRQRATLGDVVLCYQAFHQGQRLLRVLLDNAGGLYRSLLFLDNLFQFLALRPHLVPPPQPQPAPERLQRGIRFDRVRFTYPGSERPALDDFSLTLPAGQLTALVGANGAGKSTLIKLLCRFYDPQHGAILADEVDLRAFDPEEWRRRITVLFQEPTHYQATAADNIAFGDWAAAPGAEQVTAAAAAAGAAPAIERLPAGYATILGRWFGGAELSVGEWQRVALARAFLRNAPLLILDEPTSAMDAWAEHDWLHRFRQQTAGHTTLIITHRFTTAMHADRILVMDRGRIIEAGSHAELLAADGGYARAWRAQLHDAGHD